MEAVLFDCDGVLVDSEPLTNGVLREMLAELGWHLSPADCMAAFVGKAVKDEVAQIHRHTGFWIDAQWMLRFRARRDAALVAHLNIVAGAAMAVADAHARTNGRIACASGADRGKVVLQLSKVGLMPWFEGKIFSGHEMARTKPAPDVYLAAAGALEVAPGRCVVVEDTVTGVLAGVSAGCVVVAHVPVEAASGTGLAVRQAGAVATFSSMSDLPRLLQSMQKL